MVKVMLMEFDGEDRRFNSLREVELASTPTTDDKIVLDIDGIGYVFRVYDVHFSPNGLTDVNVIRLSTVTEYYSSGYTDIK